jgi:hypothetical protein
MRSLMKRPSCLFVLVGFALAGCGSGESTAPTDSPDVAGTWSGKVASSTGATATLAFTVTEHDRKVSGSGSLTIGTSSLGLSVSGTYAAPTVSLTISSQGFEPMTLAATISQTDMTGTIDGSGFVNRAITLKRQ